MIDTKNTEVAFAMNMTRKSAELAQRVQSGMALQGLTKSDFSPVTVADFAVQAYIAQAVAAQFPQDCLVGEEHASELRTEQGAQMRSVVTQFVERLVQGATENNVCDWIDLGAAEPAERFWVVDPIDGTKGYLRGGQYAVAFALIENGVVQVGALGCPNLSPTCEPGTLAEGALLIARRGEGAWVTALSFEEELQPLQVSSIDDPTQTRILRSFESGHTNADQIGEIAKALDVQAEPVLLDSQAKYALLAAGHGDMLFRLLTPGKPNYKEKIWDHAGGAIILEEAGGRVTDLSGAALDFTQGRTLAKNTGIFASNGKLHDAGLKAIAKVCG